MQSFAGKGLAFLFAIKNIMVKKVLVALNREKYQKIYVDRPCYHEIITLI